MDGKYKLIIIDDEQEIRIGLENYFDWDEIGFSVSASFETPLQALEYLKTHKIDVVLSDIKMPKMSGLQFAKKLRDSGNTVQIVFLSGYKEFDFLKEAMEYKISHYLLKPVTRNEIRKTFGQLKAELDAERLGSGQKEPGEDLGVIALLKTYLSENYMRTSLEDAADYVHMNPFYLSRYFKEKTKKNFSDYLIDLKMKKALELMSNLELKIYHVSEMVGYNNPNNFSRAFKRMYGKSPKDYRGS